MRIGRIKLFLERKIKDRTKLKLISVTINKSKSPPVILMFVNSIGTCKKKNRMLAKKVDVKIIFDSS